MDRPPPLDTPGVDVTSPAASAAPAERYAFREVLGTGGMGEVRLCRDKVIGREVALKIIKERGGSSRADMLERFLREARVQGQLEHPSVVPVYDLGTDGADGSTFFTMKRVRGMTLADVIAKVRDGAPGFAERYSRRRLLTAFTNVCLAIDFAHARGVLHRDIKPGNVMLGDFGEVHVLDWGLAKVAGAEDLGGDAEPIDEVTPSSGRTEHGQLLGTPGYASPEQVRGEAGALDARTDVYALGAILFEILALEPLHARPNIGALLVATLKGSSDARASARAPDRDVPPELDAICVRATALDAKDRFASARELSDAVERYLDGDRDTQRRKELAEEHAAAARHAAAESAEAGASGRAARVEAMRQVTRALALDPNHAGAMATLARLLVEVPDELPPEAEAEAAAQAARARREGARATAIRYATWVAFIPAVVAMGVRDWAAGGVAIAFLVISMAVAYWMYMRGRTAALDVVGLLALSSVALGWTSTLFGPFILVPGLAATNTLFYAMHAERSTRRLLLMAGLATVVVPSVLELAGVTNHSYAFLGERIVVAPRMASFPFWPTSLVLFVSSILLVLTPTVLVGRMRDALAAAERRLLIHSWHLRQLVPDAARRGSERAKA